MHYGDHLSEYEKQEIEKYSEIWYLGLCSFKINAKPNTVLNCGYDDDNGSYNEVSYEYIFTIQNLFSFMFKGSLRPHLVPVRDFASDRKGELRSGDSRPWPQDQPTSGHKNNS